MTEDSIYLSSEFPAIALDRCTNETLTTSSIGQNATTSIMDTSDPDLNELLQSLGQDEEQHSAQGLHVENINPDQMFGEMFNNFPLENGIDMEAATNNPLMASGPFSKGISSLTPDAINNVTSHEGLDRLMNLVQRQSEAIHSQNTHFSNSQPSASATLTNLASTHSSSGNIVTNPSLEDQQVNKNPPRTVQLTEAHTMRSSHEQNTRSSTANPFHIDTSRLAAVPMAEQSAELQNLGLTVYNREDIEQGIMEQVDQAIAEQEEERLKKLLEKQLKAVVDEIKNVKQDLANATKVERMVGPSPSNREARQKLDSVRKQKESKIKQYKKLKAKQKLLTKKLEGNADGLEEEEEELLAEDGDVALQTALGIGSQSKETERERMIRQGEMTPFGTVMSAAAKSQGPRLSKNGEMTGFEKYLMDQQQKISAKKKQSSVKKSRSETKKLNSENFTDKSTNSKKSSSTDGAKKSKMRKSHSSPALLNGKGSDSDDEMPSFASGRSKERPDRPNLFDAKDKRRYRPSEHDFSNYRSSRPRYSRLQHNFSGDGRMSDCGEYDEEDVYGNDAEYIPDANMLMQDDSDYLSGHEPGLETPKKPKVMKKRANRKRVSALESVMNEGSSDDEEGTSKSKRHKSDEFEDVSLKRTRDDGDYECFRNRIRRWKKERLKRKQQKAEDGETESSDSEFENIEIDDAFQLPEKVWNKLYPYQQTCVRWLYELHTQQAGGIVGDEMGLGKTVQIISFLAGLKVSHLPDKGANTKYKGLGPTLIVCPATVMHQWVREFHKWWPPFRVAILHNSGSYNTSVYQLIDDVASSHGILITSYASLTLNQDALLEYDWHYIILDEGHKIRNPDAKVTVAAKRFRTCHRIILSGSPVQNNLKELWSLFDFVFPGKLGTLPDFMAHFSVPIVQGGYSTASQVQVQTAYKCACVLRDTINPYLLRRMKSDVRHNLTLPDKNEQVLFCRLTEDQRDVYKEYLDSKECHMILKGDFMVFPGLITLRKVCNHPDLSTGGPQAFDSAYREYPDGERKYGHWKRSGKMVVVRSLLELWRKQGHRVLLFTQSKQMLYILEDFVLDQGYTYLKMDGGTSIAARQPLINKFNQDTSFFVFLLTTRVGGLGVNLTGANRIVIYDPDWNPSTDMQARERAWRIGQKKQVTIYRLLTAGTIEEKIYHRQIFKQFLTNRVLKDPKQRRLFKANDMFELFSLNEVGSGGSTETSAIFAGTGMDVRVKLSALPKDKKKEHASTSAKKPNRFDVLLERREKEKAAAEGEMEEDEEDEDSALIRDYMAATDGSKEQPNRVKSIKKEKNKGKKETLKVPSSAEQSESQNSEKTNGEVSESSSSATGRNTPMTGRDTPTISDKNDEVEDPKLVKMRELARKLSQQFGKKKEDKDTTIKQEVDNKEVIAASSDVRKDAESVKSRHKHKKTKHKDKDRDKRDEKQKHEKRKKKKKKDAIFEGERIANLSKTEMYVPSNEKGEEKTDSVDQDSYVLARLLNKSGVHSALQHDKIMMSAEPDYALVEGEAERVAQEAAKALRRSRQQCPSARSGMLTWTGQTGSAPQAKPRFGQKKNSKLLPSTSSTKESPSKQSTEKKPVIKPPASSAKHFDGSLAGNIQTETGKAPGVMTSSQLLARMKARNSLSLGEDGAEPGSATKTNEANIELITDIRNFVSFQSHVNGQASTQEIVEYFKTRIPDSSSATFKAMLKQICELHKRDSVGLWILKPEFR